MKVVSLKIAISAYCGRYIFRNFIYETNIIVWICSLQWLFIDIETDDLQWPSWSYPAGYVCAVGGYLCEGIVLCVTPAPMIQYIELTLAQDYNCTRTWSYKREFSTSGTGESISDVSCITGTSEPSLAVAAAGFSGTTSVVSCTLVDICTTAERLSKNVQNYFCHNLVKFSVPLTVKIFGTKMTERIDLREVYSFSTSPNLCQYTTQMF